MIMDPLLDQTTPPVDPPADPPVDPPVDPPADTPADPPVEGQNTEGGFDVKLPEGYEADAGLLEVLKETVKDSATGQKLVDTFIALQERTAEKARTEWERQQQTWIEEFKQSKDFKANEAAAGRAMAQFGSPDLRKFLDDSGLGNHPLLANLLVSVGKALAEDNVAGTGVTPASNASGKNPILGIYTHPTSAKS